MTVDDRTTVTMMRAVVQDGYGGSEVLAVREVPVPRVEGNRVLVEVRGAGVEMGQWHFMAGSPKLVRFQLGLRAPKQPIRGWDFAGVVAAVGPEVSDLAVGDEVLGAGSGSFAEFISVPESAVVPKPAGIGWEAAATVATSGVTALQALRDQLAVREGDRVLVFGAAGGVGNFAVQIAKAMGAHVTGVCSGPKTGMVLSTGADEVVDYTKGEPVGSWDAIVDTAGGRSFRALRRLLSDRGRVAIIGDEEGGDLVGPMRRFGRAKLGNLVGRTDIVGTISTITGSDLQELATMLETGALAPVIDRVSGLDGAASLIDHLASGGACGKSVVVP